MFECCFGGVDLRITAAPVEAGGYVAGMGLVSDRFSVTVLVASCLASILGKANKQHAAADLVRTPTEPPPCLLTFSVAPPALGPTLTSCVAYQFQSEDERGVGCKRRGGSLA